MVALGSGVAGRIKRYRESQHLSQKKLADMVETSRGYLSAIERGIKDPSYNFLTNFLEATGVSSEWILRGTGPMLYWRAK